MNPNPIKSPLLRQASQPFNPRLPRAYVLIFAWVGVLSALGLWIAQPRGADQVQTVKAEITEKSAVYLPLNH